MIKENDLVVGIILPVYNGETTIIRAIESVLKQSYPLFNLYIINDASSDNTSSIIEPYLSDTRIFIHNMESNSGVAAARNRGLDVCEQTIIAFIDSDDEWHKSKLADQVAEIKKGNNFIISDYIYKSDYGQFTIANDCEQLSTSAFIKKEHRICFSSVCINTSDCKKRFLEIGHEDFEYLYFYFKYYAFAKIIRKPLVTYHVTENSLSSKKCKALIWHYNVLKLVLDNQLQVFYYYFFYIKNALLFKLKNRGA